MTTHEAFGFLLTKLLNRKNHVLLKKLKVNTTTVTSWRTRYNQGKYLTPRNMAKILQKLEAEQVPETWKFPEGLFYEEPENSTITKPGFKKREPGENSN